MSILDAKTREEISQLLPWYANGTLDPQDKARVEFAVKQDAQLRAELELVLEDQAATLDVIGQESVSDLMAERFKVALNQEAARLGDSSDQQTKPVTVGFFRQVAKALFPTKPVTYMASAAMLLLVLQSGAIISLMSDLPGNPSNQFPPAAGQNELSLDGFSSSLTAEKKPLANSSNNAGPESKKQKAVLVRVLFRDTVGMEQITAFLKNNDGEIIGGPKSNGEFLLMFKLVGNEDKQQLMDRLRRQASLFKGLSEK